VSTPGLAVPSSIPLQAYVKRSKNASGLPGQSSAIATSELLVHSSNHITIDYLGREEAGGADSLLKHYLGVYDPATGKLQVMEARKMVIRGTVRSHEAGPEAFSEKGRSTVCAILRSR
jgi:DNA-directed RNA polymerase I subunit RPA49